MYRRSLFNHFSKGTARAAGHPIAFIASILIVIAWIVTGPIFHYSDTWQLVINTATTVVTFLMVFLIQNTQNRDSEAIQLKLDELIRSLQGAHNALLDFEELTETELDAFRDKYEALATRARTNLRKGMSDTDTPEIEIEVGEGRSPEA